MKRRHFLQTAAGGVTVARFSSLLAKRSWSSQSVARPTEDGVNLRRSLELAGENLLATLSPVRNYLPYWAVEIDRDYTAYARFTWPQHNLGRWWDAMLRLENAIGFHIPPDREAPMLNNLHSFFDNPDHFCLAPLHFEGPGLELHSLREGLLALDVLARYRNSRWAEEKGRLMIENILRVSDEKGSWKLDQIDTAGRFDKGYYKKVKLVSTSTNGRLIEPLVRFYLTTKDPIALRAADRFAHYHLRHTTYPDGRLNLSSGSNHTHSYFGTLRGLLLYGEITGQHEYVEAVAATYRKTVRTLVKRSGFISHDLEKDSRGETASPGDAAQLALWLATRHGFTEYLDDVERIVRARIIPSQITETPPLRPPSDEAKDEYQNLRAQVIGAFGGMHLEPHAGKKPTTDITAADVHTLVDVYKHIALQCDSGLKILLHFDYEDARVRIRSKRQKVAELTVLPKIKANIFIRIPRWAPLASIRLRVQGKPVGVEKYGDFVLIPREFVPAEITLQFDLPVISEIERTDGVDYRILWRGDEVIGITPNSSFYPFYPFYPDYPRR